MYSVKNSFFKISIYTWVVGLESNLKEKSKIKKTEKPKII